MTAEELLLKIGKKDIAPVYFLHGEERFFHAEIVNALVEVLIAPGDREFNLETYDARDRPVHDWLGGARTFSFMGGTKLVVARNLDEAAFKETEVQLILDYTADPSPGTCLVMTAEKADRKKKLFKALTALPGAVECAPPKEATLAPWLTKRAQGQGYRLGTDAARLLLDRVGNKPGLLAGELEKVLIYAGDAREITENHVAEIVGEIRAENVFALTEALKTKNTEEALRVLRRQLDHDEEPLKVLGTIAWQFRLIWEVKCHQEKRLLPQKIAEMVGAKPFVVEKAMKHTKNFTERQLRAAFGFLFQADRELKTTGKNPRTVLESLVLELCSDGGFR
ncbi:MAG: DNA polymerase III subunit delta [Nitrospinae bacterium]|nr:DNA polymerase III subunit delta [Nitrospinota bacterium]